MATKKAAKTIPGVSADSFKNATLHVSNVGREHFLAVPVNADVVALIPVTIRTPEQLDSDFTVVEG